MPGAARPMAHETSRNGGTKKDERLKRHTRNDEDTYLTTNTGTRVHHTDDSLKAGERGPTLMEDFHFREKMMHFDHERIPERVVHARGSGAHGYFQVYEPLSDLTKASLFQDPTKKTPVFVRFSTVVGFRGSADTVRDVRGFATKFYTEEGNWDLVGNNIPVFFIQDAIKFPDLVHSIKPEPDNEMPQAAAAHDTFWDFVSLTPETAHMLMWVLSDRAIPKSYRMMEGFGVHTFRLVNKAGEGHFVKFHWRPKLGTHSLVWDEAQTLAGKDPDYNRRDLFEAIENGDHPEYELGIQVIDEEREHSFDFDLLDPTKIVPLDEVPLRIVGKMTLDRNPDNFFAETEQVAFHPGHVVPGIDFTNDPLLQGRLFSYLDTQITRLGGPNFNEIPINRPVAPVHNNQRDGFMRQIINKGKSAYSRNTIRDDHPKPASWEEGGFVHYTEKVDGRKVRGRSEKFRDFFSQATMFWNSITEDEQDRLVAAGIFELGKVKDKRIRHNVIHDIFNHIDHDMATRVAEGVGVEPPKSFAGKTTKKRAPEVGVKHQGRFDTIQTRRIAVLMADGYDHNEYQSVKKSLEHEGAMLIVVSKKDGILTSADGQEVEVDKAHVTTTSAEYDAVYVPGAKASVETQMQQGDALHFIQEAYKHAKPIGATGEGVRLVEAARLPGAKLSGQGLMDDKGVVTSRKAGKDFLPAFIKAIAQHRHFDREEALMQVAA
jgi:catalase